MFLFCSWRKGKHSLTLRQVVPAEAGNAAGKLLTSFAPESQREFFFPRSRLRLFPGVKDVWFAGGCDLSDTSL
jgi:hypothetical protein